MADVEILASQVEPAPLTYSVPGGQEIILKVAAATFDGSAASSNWQPALQIVGPSGQVLRTFALSPSLSAGAIADVTWFRGVAPSAASGGGISEIDSLSLDVTDNTGPTTQIELPAFQEEQLIGGGTLAPNVTQQVSFTHNGGNFLTDLTTPTNPKITLQGIYAIFIKMAVTAVTPSSAYAFLTGGTATGGPSQQFCTIDLPYAAVPFTGSGGWTVGTEGTIEAHVGALLQVFLSNGDPTNSQALGVTMIVKYLGLRI